jgi:hypothetical protein
MKVQEMRKFIYLVLTLSMSVGAHAGSILAENFESATAGFYASGAIAGTAFSVVSGSIDIVGPGSYGWLCAAPASGNCVDTTGSTGSTPGRGVFETTNLLNLTPGPYVLTFSLAHWNDTQDGGGPQDATISVSLGGLYSETFTVDSSWVDQQVVRNITVASSTSANLLFTDLSGTAGFAGAIVDNVTLDSVPEPSTLCLLGLGLAVLPFARRRIANPKRAFR